MLNIKEVCDNDHLDRARWSVSKCDLLDLREQRTAPDQPSTSSIFRAGPFDQSKPSQFSNGALLCGLADLLIGILVTTNALSSLLKTDFTALFYVYLAKTNSSFTNFTSYTWLYKFYGWITPTYQWEHSSVSCELNHYQILDQKITNMALYPRNIWLSKRKSETK